MTLSIGFAFKFAFAAARLYPWRCSCSCRDRSSTHRLSLHTASLSARQFFPLFMKGIKVGGNQGVKVDVEAFRPLLLLFLQVVPQCTAHETTARSVAHKLAEARGHPIEAATRLATNACQLLRAAGVFTCELAVRCRCPRRSSNFELRRASIPQCWRGRICPRSWSLTSDCFSVHNSAYVQALSLMHL